MRRLQQFTRTDRLPAQRLREEPLSSALTSSSVRALFQARVRTTGSTNRAGSNGSEAVAALSRSTSADPERPTYSLTHDACPGKPAAIALAA